MYFTLKLILAVISALTTIVLVAGGIMLWMRRKETNDYSRYVLAIFCWFTSLNSFFFIIRHWVGNIVVNKGLLGPETVFASIIMQMTYFFYPLVFILPERCVRLWPQNFLSSPDMVRRKKRPWRNHTRKPGI